MQVLSSFHRRVSMAELVNIYVMHVVQTLPAMLTSLLEMVYGFVFAQGNLCRYVMYTIRKCTISSAVTLVNISSFSSSLYLQTRLKFCCSLIINGPTAPWLHCCSSL